METAPPHIFFGGEGALETFLGGMETLLAAAMPPRTASLETFLGGMETLLPRLRCRRGSIP